MFDFSNEEHRALMLIFQESLSIQTPTEMFMWLQGDIQRFIPHETLIAAWGDIAGGRVSFNIVSADTKILADDVPVKTIALITQQYFDKWMANSCRPITVYDDRGFGVEHGAMTSEIMYCLKRMRSVAIHGIDDLHGNSICMAFHTRIHSDSSAVRRMTELIVPFIDVTLRRVRRRANLPEYCFNATGENCEQSQNTFGLSVRELEIMNWVRYGKTNQEIGMILSISIFTVKNHMQHIFEKLNVVNRTQAVAKFVTPQEKLSAGAH